VLPNKATPLVNPNLAIIEETVDDCAGTGMDNIKVLLRDPQRKVGNPNSGDVDKKAYLYREMTKVMDMPKSVDVLQKKQQRNYPNDEKNYDRVRELKDINQRVNLPHIPKQRHLVH
jgi:hypothetical protein